MRPTQILIVDDDASVRKTVRLCLEMAGYRCDEASDGHQAMEAVRTGAPDLVLLDLAMPCRDGMTFLRELGSAVPRPAARVIVMTAHGSVRVAINAVRLGASDFLEKPFLPDDLRQSVASVLASDAPAGASPAGGYTDVLGLVASALRGGRFAEAERLLMRAGTISDDDPAFLNLAGALHEAHGRRASAQRFYERATAADPTFEAARENLRRLGEIATRGTTRRPVAFGNVADSRDELGGLIGMDELDRRRRFLK